MLDYILSTAQSFEREHGIAPDVIYINPMHYEQLTRTAPELFVPGGKLHLGFRLMIVPANVLAHPHASLLTARYSRVTTGAVTARGGGDVSGWR
ncbi:MAG TPA: hypothetical protein VET88_01375 [Gammaproteobacteria bacterium]|nr:hypothetical protein [Gammaproteobacteria bacterium]